MKDSIALPSPLLLPVLFWIIGIGVAFAIPGQSYAWIIGLVFAAAAWFFPRLRLYLLLLLILVLGYQRLDLTSQHPSVFDHLFYTKSNIRQNVVFEVRSVHNQEFDSYIVRVDSLAGAPLQEQIILYGKAKLTVGSAYRAMADLQPLRQDDLLDNGFRRYPAKAYVVGEAHLIPASAHWQRQLARSLPMLRNDLLQLADSKIGEHSGLAKALLLSDSSAKYEMKDRLTRGGMIHLVVVSGLHVWFIYLMLMVLFNLFLPRRLAELIFLIVALCFTALNNWAPSVVRSVLMIAIFIVSRWFSRPLSKLQILSVSLFIITIIAPRQLFSVGLQLSYICVGIILFALPRVQLWHAERTERSMARRFVNAQFNYIVLSLLVGIGVFPITLYYFNQASLNGIIGNILGVPLIGLLLPLSFLLMLIPAGNTVFEALHLSYEWIFMLFGKWVDICARLPLYFDRVYFSTAALVISLQLIVLLYMALNRKWRLLKLALIPVTVISLLVVLLPRYLQPDSFKVIVFNAGLADCSLIQLPTGENIMIDTGVGWTDDATTTPDEFLQASWMRRKLLSWLLRNNVKQIDWLILSHMHVDHYGGFPALVTTLPVKNIAVTDETIQTAAWNAWQSWGYLKGSTVHVISDTISYYAGKSRLQFLHPDNSYFTSNENNRSIVLRLSHGTQRYLFTGDIEKDAEEYLLDHYPMELAAQYIKIPHHGSKSSGSDLFLETVHPREAWISTSLHNRYGFPHSQTTERLNHHQIRYRITADGSIIHYQN